MRCGLLFGLPTRRRRASPKCQTTVSLGRRSSRLLVLRRQYRADFMTWRCELAARITAETEPLAAASSDSPRDRAPGSRTALRYRDSCTSLPSAFCSTTRLQPSPIGPTVANGVEGRQNVCGSRWCFVIALTGAAAATHCYLEPELRLQAPGKFRWRFAPHWDHAFAWRPINGLRSGMDIGLCAALHRRADLRGLWLGVVH